MNNRKSKKSFFDLACIEWDKGNDKEAFRFFKKAVEKGDSRAIHNLAYFYDEGIGVRKNRDKAIDLYQQSYRLNNVSSAINLGLLYKSESNWERARFWLLRAMERGDGDAAFELAKMYTERRGPGFRDKALLYLKKAKSLGQLVPFVEEEVELLLKEFSS